MRIVQLKKLVEGPDYDGMRGKKPILNRVKVLHAVRDDCLFMDAETEEPLGCYLMLDSKHLEGMRHVARTTKITATARAYAGLPTKSAVFGMVPRTPIRQDYCRWTQNSLNEPANHGIVRDFGTFLSSIYRRVFPENYDEAMKAVEEVNPCWLMPETPFATCSLNYNHAIKYHRDTGNISDAFSNVLILREGVVGGQLLFPEYGLLLAQQDRAFSIFNGNKLLHGVLPIRQTAVDGYRASIVYYTLSGTRNCLSMPGEIERIRQERLLKEQRRLEGIDPRDVKKAKTGLNSSPKQKSKKREDEKPSDGFSNQEGTG